MKWPTNWREALLREAGIEVTQYALDVLDAWHRSTPIEPWTNNPLGHPAVPGKISRALSTQYGAVVDHEAFRDLFAAMLDTPRGQAVREALTREGAHASAWRAIRGLNWPGNITETDYPSAVLDMVEAKYRGSMSSTPASARTSAGVNTGMRSLSHPLREAARGMGMSAARFNDFEAHLRAGLRRGKSNG